MIKALDNGKSSKYVTLYPYDKEKNNTDAYNENEVKEGKIAKYAKNIQIYGDAIRETSKAGIDNNSWYSDLSHFLSCKESFFMQGGNYGYESKAGLFSFYSDNGDSAYPYGFRPVLVTL